jgi:RNA polymerase sigma factor (sigma-70 family)
MYSEEELISGCIKGKRSAQKALYDLYASRMFGICLRYARNRDDAEDMLQEGFIKIYSSMSSFRGQGSFEGWMKRIMVNNALNMLRKNAKAFLFSELNESTYVVPDETENENDLMKLYGEISPQILMKQIAALPDGYKVVFNLYAIEDYSHKEIGEMLNISENTSKSQLSRARKYLRKRLEELISVDNPKPLINEQR